MQRGPETGTWMHGISGTEMPHDVSEAGRPLPSDHGLLTIDTS